MKRQQGWRHRGLSLLEVLVALAVAAAFLGVLLPLLTQLRDRAQRDARMLDATVLAEAQVAQLSVWPARLPSPSQGRSGSLNWSVQEEQAQPAPQAGAMVLRRFRVRVTDSQDATVLVDLTLLRLGREE